MTPSIQMVIFDCDGVLVDSERLAVRIDALVLASLGWEISEAEIVERFVGRSDAYMRRIVGERLGRVLEEDWDADFSQLYRETFERELRPVDGVVDALDRIALPSCIASSGSHRKLRFTLGLTDLFTRFEGRIFSGDEVENGKPAPDLFLHAAKQMRVEPQHCAVIEDSRFGVEAARAAGMHAFGYAGGLTSGDVLGQAGAIVFDDMCALPGLLVSST